MISEARQNFRFRSMVDIHLYGIVQKLQNSGDEPESAGFEFVEIEKPRPPDPVPAPAPPGAASLEQLIDIAKGEAAGRAMLLPQSKVEESERWIVFVGDWRSLKGTQGSFALRDRLPESGDRRAFVSSAYEVFLNRPADQEGLENYVSHLKTGKLSPRDFIKILLTSEEGLRHAEPLVVMQDTHA